MVAEPVRATGFGDEEGGEIDKKEEDDDKVGEINQVPKTKSIVKPKAKAKRREHFGGTGRGHVSLVKGGVGSEGGGPLEVRLRKEETGSKDLERNTIKH